jgi:hypothetical protein
MVFMRAGKQDNGTTSHYSDFIHIGAVTNHARQETSIRFFIGLSAIMWSMNNTGGTIVPRSASAPIDKAMGFMGDYC